ncbi:SAM-dependent methyltransferase [Streptomyces syringium]|uniref:SAM-dependent methyltransferase n=1 Tax=Streptomyces syringium TaxID=76729 RepID=UPI003D8DE6D0
MRAQEHRRPDRLFADPYAQHFLDASGDAIFVAGTQTAASTPELFTLMADQVAVRTRFLDDALTSAARAGTPQVVLLACGMDARAFRLDWPPATALFEVDFADTLAYRAAALAAHDITATCRRTEVPTDLRENWPTALCAAARCRRPSTRSTPTPDGAGSRSAACPAELTISPSTSTAGGTGNSAELRGTHGMSHNYIGCE